MNTNKSKFKKSKFIDEAAYRIKNKKWLRYSSNISRRILAAIEDDQEINRDALADKMNVSMQYISKLVQGSENLSLQTIAKISDALGVELITFPEYKYSKKTGNDKQFTQQLDVQDIGQQYKNSNTKLRSIKGGAKSYDQNGFSIAS